MSLIFDKPLLFNSDYWETQPFNFYSKKINGLPSPTWQDIILSGYNSLTLLNAKFNSLEYLKLFGECELKDPNLPAGYTKLKYLSLDGSQYFDTGIYIDQDMEVVCKWRVVEESYTNAKYLYGVSNSNNTASCTAYIPQSSGNWRFGDKYVGITFDLNTWYTTKQSVSGVLVDDTNNAYSDVSNFTTELTLTVGMQKQSSGSMNTARGFIGDMEYFQIIKNNVLLFNAIPCKNSQGVCGVYDTVSETFIPSATETPFSGVEEEITPVPSSPVDIYCNNGKISNQWVGGSISEGLWARAYISTSGSNANTWRYSSDASSSIRIPIQPNVKYRLYWDSTDSDIVGTIFRVAFIKSSSYPGASGEFKYVFDETGERGVLLNGSPSSNQSTIFTVSDTNIMYIVIQVSGSATAWTDGDFSQLWDRVSHLHLQAEEIIIQNPVVETVEDELENSATAQNLFGVSTYKDIQEVLTGAITRKVVVKFLDGTEDWKATSGQAYAGNFYIQNATADWGVLSYGAPVLCTHFVFKANTDDYAVGEAIFTMHLNVYSGLETVNAHKAWLAEQYANGTPVIIIYPLATPTSETVTAQPMNVQRGTNTIEVTQSSLDSFLEAKYKAGVVVTISEIENVNIDNQVTVTVGE